MIDYEVTIEVELAIADDYRRWLHTHVEQMLALPGFVEATIAEVIEPSRADCRSWRIGYRLVDEAALNHYLDTHAQAMRADGLNRFGERFRASRRVLRPVGKFRPKSSNEFS